MPSPTVSCLPKGLFPQEHHMYEGTSVAGQGHHQQLWLLTVFLHPGLIFPVVSI